jgi:hypothetical protein
MIHRNGHGKYGLLPTPTLSSNSAQLPSSGVLANTRMEPLRLCCLSSPLQTGRDSTCPTLRTGTISCDSSRMSRGALASRVIARC